MVDVRDKANAVRLTQSEFEALRDEVKRLEQDRAMVTDDRNRLLALINSPVTEDFLKGVRNEVAHQVIRWPGDAAKTHVDWLGVVAWLSGKAARAMERGDRDKALHHTISTAAVCCNWHAHLSAQLAGESEPENG